MAIPTPKPTEKPVLKSLGTEAGRQTRAAILFLAPSAIVLAVFVFWPIIQSLNLSLHQWRFGVHEQKWVGLANYTRLWHDPRAWAAFKNTLYFSALFVPLSIVLPLLLALGLNQALPLRTLMRSILFLPVIASFSVMALVWRFLFDPDIGLLIYWAGTVGISRFSPLRDPHWAMPAVILVTLWKNLGFNMVIYLAGLQGIPKSLYEAALIDNAGPWRRFASITMPQLRETHVFVLVITAISAFQVFDPSFVLTPNGGPLFSTDTIVTFIYRQGITNFDLSYAAAAGVILFLIVLALTLAQLWLTRSERH